MYNQYVALHVAKLVVPKQSARAQDMPSSSIRQMFKAVERIRDGGEEVIPLHIGDPDFPLPSRITAAVNSAMALGRTHYSPAAGIERLREAAARHSAGRLGLPFTAAPALAPAALSPQHVVCSQGATHALNACLQLACNIGDTILLPEVHFPNYLQQAALAGVRARLYPLDAHFQPRLDALEQTLDDSVRALLINTPGNPAGALFAPDTIRALYDFARRHNLWIISDEAYIDYVYHGEHLSPLQVDWEQSSEQRRVLGVFSFSKSYAATGLRCGWTLCPYVGAARRLGLMNEPLIGCMSTPLQWGMVAALAEDDTAGRRASLNDRRLLAAEVLNDHGFEVRPVDGGMFYFVDISATGLSSDEFADALLAEEHVAVVPGSGFGLQPRYGDDGRLEFTASPLAARHVRICFAIDPELLADGLSRLARFIRRHSR